MGARKPSTRIAFSVQGVAWSLLLLLTLISSCTCTTSRCPKSTRFFGFSLLAASSCRKYVMCFRGRLSRELPCPAQSAFDPVLQTCSRAAFEPCQAQESVVEVQTQLICPKTPEATYYPDYSRGCPDEHYFRCKDGVLSGFNCPDGLVFDEGVDECVPRSEVTCEAGGPVCTRPSGVYANYTSGGCPTTDFSICTGKGTALNFSCSSGLYYNGAIKNCDFKSNIVCSINVQYRIENN
ncbi:hypothetical protein BaRGS_00008351 [Batillaria attramentaria]|uniref:Chitin-binding type-2 domain-containing protein n=1 Tax=Batillaria attramentaria TaxID=370345 RepID=A0ABD0LM24_9CAEN